MPPLKLFRRADDRPSLRDRAAALKAKLARITRRPDGADPSRRLMVAGSLATAFPLPALAARAVSAGPHPDASLLAAGARYERAVAAETAAYAACEAAYAPVRAVLETCPPAFIATYADRRLILGCGQWPTKVGGLLRFIPGADGGMREAWTGEVLRNAISQAVPRLGRGGQMPHHIARWKALLPAVDAFDARVQAVEAVSDYPIKRKARDAAFRELWDALSDVRAFTPSTPEGLAFLIRVCALDHGRGCHISPNLLHGAANVIGLDLEAVDRPRAGFFH